MEYPQHMIEALMMILHNNDKAICEAMGDESQPDWLNVEQWQRDSAMEGIGFIVNNPDAPASALHDNWVKDKLADGWVYGEAKDANAKTHPCLVPFPELSLDMQIKDHVFKSTVKTLLNL